MGFGKDGRGSIIYQRVDITVGALGPLTMELTSSYSLVDHFRILRAELYCIETGVTAGETGELLVGLADGSLTDSEIEDAIESIAVEPGGSNTEEAERPVWPIGLMPHQGEAAIQGTHSQDGKPWVWTKRWTFREDTGWKWWIYNLGSNNRTTGATLRIFAKLYGVWVT